MCSIRIYEDIRRICNGKFKTIKKKRKFMKRSRDRFLQGELVQREIDVPILQYKKFGGELIKDIKKYIIDYISNVDSNAYIAVGCDSVNIKRFTVYSSTICFRNDEMKDGVHVIFTRFKQPKIRDIFSRLYVEVDYVLKLSMFIDYALS